MREISTYGNIESGKLKIYKKREFLESIEILGGNKKVRVEIIIKKLYKKRSNEQNRYYWGYIIMEFCRGFKETTGEIISKEQAHEFLKSKFLYIEFVNEEHGTIERIPRQSSKLTTVEWIEFNDECGKFITEWFGITILEPNQQSELIF